MRVTSSSLNNPWFLSAALHGVAVAAILALLFQSPMTSPHSSRVDFDVLVQAVPKPVAPAPMARPAPQKKAHAVFGLSRHAIVAAPSAHSAVEIKAGNTIAKSADQEALGANDADSLPSPVDEFLVSQMPVLADEVRVPYPAEAKRLGVEGAVVMDLLIDAEGKVRDAQLVTGPGSGLDEAALGAVKGFRFKPALVEGQPVAVRIRYAYRFVLEH